MPPRERLPGTQHDGVGALALGENLLAEIEANAVLEIKGRPREMEYHARGIQVGWNPAV